MRGSQGGAASRRADSQPTGGEIYFRDRRRLRSTLKRLTAFETATTIVFVKKRYGVSMQALNTGNLGLKEEAMVQRDQSKRMSPESVGDGVYDPKDFRGFSPEGPTVVGMYGDDIDMSIVIWNLEPGQEDPPHSHATNAQAIYVLEGTGVSLREEAPPVPIKAGQCLIVPRNVVRGIRNTGDARLSYMTVSSWGGGGGGARTSTGG